MDPRPYQLIVFGATGLTARATLSELLHGSSTRWSPSFTWAIAGRNLATLESLRASLFCNEDSDGTPRHAVPRPSIVVADVCDGLSLSAMACQTKLLLNCVGPYREYGEPVVKACIEARTDYLDLCGEPAFIERMHLMYHEAAVKADITVVHAVAFDSVPCDLGVLLCKKLLADRGAYPSSVEMFFSLKMSSTHRQHMNFATYEAAIKGFSSTAGLRQVRKELSRVRPKPVPVGPTVAAKGANRILARFGIIRDPRVDGWLVPYFFSDPAVVRLSQSLTLHLTKTPPAALAPVHFAAYIQIPQLQYLLLFMLYFIVFQFLAVREWGRNLLYGYPELFTGGLAMKNMELPDNARDATSFTQTYYARGYSSALHPTPLNSPDTDLTLRITGPEPGYHATPIIFLEAASVLLRRRDTIPRGVLTPAVAFGALETFSRTTTKQGEGGVMDALQRDGRVTWSVVKA